MPDTDTTELLDVLVNPPAEAPRRRAALGATAQALCLEASAGSARYRGVSTAGNFDLGSNPALFVLPVSRTSPRVSANWVLGCSGNTDIGPSPESANARLVRRLVPNMAPPEIIRLLDRVMESADESVALEVAEMLLRNNSPAVRASAVAAVESLAPTNPQVIESLSAILRDDPDPTVRRVASEVLDYLD